MGVVLNKGDDSAHFLPEKGMNLISFIARGFEFIDQQTKPLFEERFAGLGAMIGPHFHHRPAEEIPPLPDEKLFPHIKAVKAKGAKEPFSHGIGRYAPWTICSQTESSLLCELKGNDRWNGSFLKDFERQDFQMFYEARLGPEGLEISLSVQSEKPSIVGLHTYYALEKGQGVVSAFVQNQVNDMGTFKSIPSTWNYNKGLLRIPMPDVVDYGFLPYPDKHHGTIVLETGGKRVQVQYWSDSEENSWQLWHPSGGTFVCIEPLSARNPRKCISTSSSIKILISLQ